MNADPFVFHPGDVAMSLGGHFHQQREAIWKSDGTSDFRHAPETETLRTRQLIVPVNTITPAFRVRRRTFCRFSDIAIGFDARTIKKKVPKKNSLWSIVPIRY